MSIRMVSILLWLRRANGVLRVTRAGGVGPRPGWKRGWGGAPARWWTGRTIGRALTQALPLVGGGDVHRFPVLCHGSAGDGDAFGLQDFRQPLVGQRLSRVLR